MKKKEKKELKVKLLTAINRTLLDNKAIIKRGTEKAVKKTIRAIVKHAKKRVVAVAAAK